MAFGGKAEGGQLGFVAQFSQENGTEGVRITLKSTIDPPIEESASSALKCLKLKGAAVLP